MGSYLSWNLIPPVESAGLVGPAGGRIDQRTRGHTIHVRMHACATMKGVLRNTKRKVRFITSKVSQLANEGWNKLALVGKTTKEYLKLALSHKPRIAIGII